MSIIYGPVRIWYEIRKRIIGLQRTNNDLIMRFNVLKEIMLIALHFFNRLKFNSIIRH